MSNISVNLGEKPELMWVDIDKISVDSNYQRELKAGRVAQILKDFNWAHFQPVMLAEQVDGTFRQRFSLNSGRFAMIDDGLGFSLVPWSPSLEKQIGRHVTGVARSDGGIDWSFGRRRGLGL